MHYTDFNWSNECFLVVDDDRYSHLLLEKVLLKTGATVIHAYNGGEAVNYLLNDKRITVALVDIIMPVLNGFDVIEQTKQACPEVTFFAYTADIFRINIEECKKLGFLHCFAKPMLPVKLFAEINRMLPVKEGYK